MGIFDFLKGADINGGVEEFKNTENAVLLDVRTTDEYKGGHIGGSINIPLHILEAKVGEKIKDKNTNLFVYCLSGGRSGQAASLLKSMGYTNVKNIGGIGGYKGRIER